MDTKNTTSPASEIEALKQELAKTRSELAASNAKLEDAHAELADAHAEIASMNAEPENKLFLHLSDTALTAALNKAVSLRDSMILLLEDNELSDGDRRRLLGSGVRRYGFIDKVSDLMAINTDFIPQFLDEEQFKTLLRELEIVRNTNAAIQQTLRLSTDLLLLLGDEAFRRALTFYGAVRDAARRNVPGARELFRIMQRFFRHGRHPGDEPTEPELERDFRALLHGRKDGEIILENEKPHTVGGKHVAIDDTHKAKANFKETEEGEI